MNAETKPRIGFIGLGLMGHGMAKNLVTKGYPLTVRVHRNRKPLEDLVAAGAKEVATDAEVARASDIVFLCVTGTPQVEAIVYGVNGLLSAAREGLIVVDTSTAEPASTASIRIDFGAKRALFVDAPWVDWALIIAGGLMGTLGHLLFILAFQRGPASALTPYTYVHLVWATLSGWLVFGSFPDVWTLAGMAVITGSGLLIALHERRRARELPHEPTGVD